MPTLCAYGKYYYRCESSQRAQILLALPKRAKFKRVRALLQSAETSARTAVARLVAAMLL